MSNIKQSYTFLAVLLTNLCCSSHDRSQMDNKNTKSKDKECSTSSGYSSETSNQQQHVSEIDRVVTEFLEKEGKDMGRGIPLSDEILSMAIEKLESSINNVTMELLPSDYKYFLNTHGVIYGQGIDICGPSRKNSDQHNAAYIEREQRGFKRFCEENSRMGKVEIRSCWLVAGVDEGNTYYINTSEKGQGYIYSLDRSGYTTFFADNFLDFLKRFFRIYEESKVQHQ